MAVEEEGVSACTVLCPTFQSPYPKTFLKDLALVRHGGTDSDCDTAPDVEVIAEPIPVEIDDEEATSGSIIKAIKPGMSQYRLQEFCILPYPSIQGQSGKSKSRFSPHKSLFCSIACQYVLKCS